MTSLKSPLILKSLLALGLLPLSGCLERKEQVSIRPDGSIAVRLQIRGDAGDLDGGAAAIPGEGYRTTRRTIPKKDGEEELLEARAEYASAAAMPETYGADPTARHALRFRTAVAAVSEGGRELLRFTRVYEPRSWAPYAYHHRKALPEKVQEAMKKEGWLDQAGPERKRILQGFLDFEQAKALEWTGAALRSLKLGDEARVLEAQAAARSALRSRGIGSLSPEAILALIKKSPQAIEAEVRSIAAVTESAIAAAAAEVFPELSARGADFLAAYREAKLDFEVTEDLGDERFEVSVTFPGAVLRHNGDEAHGDTVIWRFTGEDLRDRRQRLFAVAARTP